MRRRTVLINHQPYRMWQTDRGHWLFVVSPETGRSSAVAQIVEYDIIRIDAKPALTGISNHTLADAWVQGIR